jgi:hypothetical protein
LIEHYGGLSIVTTTLWGAIYHVYSSPYCCCYSSSSQIYNLADQNNLLFTGDFIPDDLFALYGSHDVPSFNVGHIVVDCKEPVLSGVKNTNLVQFIKQEMARELLHGLQILACGSDRNINNYQ